MVHLRIKKDDLNYKKDEHISENELYELNYDYEIDNNNDVFNYYYKIDNLMRKIKNSNRL